MMDSWKGTGLESEEVEEGVQVCSMLQTGTIVEKKVAEVEEEKCTTKIDLKSKQQRPLSTVETENRVMVSRPVLKEGQEPSKQQSSEEEEIEERDNLSKKSSVRNLDSSSDVADDTFANASLIFCPAAVQDFKKSPENETRKALTEAMERIEIHIKAEQAARRAAEEALTRALTSTPHGNHSSTLLSGNTATSAIHECSCTHELTCGDLYVALHQLQQAQDVIHRADDTIRRVLESLQSTSKPQTTFHSKPAARDIIYCGSKVDGQAKHPVAWTLGENKAINRSSNGIHLRQRQSQPTMLSRTSSTMSQERRGSSRQGSEAMPDRFSTRRHDDLMILHTAKLNR